MTAILDHLNESGKCPAAVSGESVVPLPAVDWSRADDFWLASWIEWFNSDLDLWASGERGYFSKAADEDLLSAAYAERERRQEANVAVAP